VPARGPWRSVARPALLIATVACAERPDTACEPLLGDVEVAANRGPGVWQREGRVPRLVELWRTGGAGDEHVLAFPVAIAAGLDGRIAVTDFQLAEVVVVGADGGWQGAWTRPGGGPGQTRHPVAAAWLGTGDLLVWDIVGGRLVTLSGPGETADDDLILDPAFAGSVLSRGEALAFGLQPVGAPVMAATHGAPGLPDGQRLASVVRMRTDGAGSDTLAVVPHHAVTVRQYADGLPAPGSARPTFGIGAMAHLVVGAGDGSYRFLVHDGAGRPVRQVCRDAPPYALRHAERAIDSAVPGLEEALRAAPTASPLAAFGRIVADDAGGAWVQRERPGHGHGPSEAVLGVPGATYDVFDGTGRFLGTVRAPDDARIHAVAGDRVWALAFGTHDAPYVVAYRLVTD
jgi:hypothetical protein